MILAIIFDVYSDVKRATGDAQSIFDQAAILSREQIRKLKEVKRGVFDLQKNVTGHIKTAKNNVMLGKPNAVARVVATGRKSVRKIAQELGLQQKDPESKNINDEEILSLLVERGYHPTDVVTAETLKDAFGDKMGEVHADRLVYAVDEDNRKAKMAPDLGLDDLLRLIGRVDRNIRDFRQEMHEASVKKNGDAEDSEESDVPTSPLSSVMGGKTQNDKKKKNKGRKSAVTASVDTSPQGLLNQLFMSNSINGVTGQELEALGTKVRKLEAYTVFRMEKLEYKMDSHCMHLERIVQTLDKLWDPTLAPTFNMPKRRSPKKEDKRTSLDEEEMNSIIGSQQPLK